jgi:hypothetical protein
MFSLVSASKVDARLMAVAFENMLKIGSLVGTRSQKLYIRLHCLRDRNEDNRTVGPGSVWLNGRRE